MMIPTFDERGNLPPGVHAATWAEVVARFGHTPERRQLLTGLRAALDLLAACGCRRAWLDGSFVTDVEMTEGRPPGDVDVCWEVDGIDWDRLVSVAPAFHPLRGDPDLRRRRYGGDYFAVSEPLAYGVVDDFQWTRGGERKGIIAIVLG